MLLAPGHEDDCDKSFDPKPDTWTLSAAASPAFDPAPLSNTMFSDMTLHTEVHPIIQGSVCRLAKHLGGAGLESNHGQLKMLRAQECLTT